jgi:RNA polymerase sigma-70 factor (ECF subfamily)
MPGCDQRVMEAAERAARHSYGKLVAYLSARTRDIAGSEDALSEAFAAALRGWRRNGVPSNPEGWLLTVARRRMIDAARQSEIRKGAADHLELLAGELRDAPDGSDIPDERLRLMFACAHPAIDPAVRAPLMLQAVLGLDAAAIASAFLISPAAMSQRLVRAKTRIREAGIPFKVPEPAEFGERLDAVLEAIYAAYAEGWSDPAGTDAQRRDLAGEGIWLGRVAVSLLPDEPEALGLLALMLYAESRRRARRGADGSYVPLAEQDMSHWDDAIIDEAEELLSRAGTMGRIGRYQLEAAVQSAHAARRMGGHADWAAIRQLYDGLLLVSGSPVAAINRAVAIAETDGPQAGLAALDEAGADGRLAAYQPYFAARAALLARLGQPAEAAAAYDRAMGLERDPAVRHFLRQRRDRLAV